MNVDKSEVCPKCGSTSTLYNSEFDYWQCQICSNCWSDGQNDPDYEDDIPQASESIAERNIEIINQWNPS